MALCTLMNARSTAVFRLVVQLGSDHLPRVLACACALEYHSGIHHMTIHMLLMLRVNGTW